MESFRDKVISVSHHAKGESGVVGGVSDADMVWASALAVYRAVDAVLGAGGRPRISFVRQEAEGGDFGRK